MHQFMHQTSLIKVIRLTKITSWQHFYQNITVFQRHSAQTAEARTKQWPKVLWKSQVSHAVSKPNILKYGGLMDKLICFFVISETMASF